MTEAVENSGHTAPTPRVEKRDDRRAEVECNVAPMKTSAGMDYFVHLRCGDREITPHVFKEEWKAEYEVAEWKWFFGQGDKPDLLTYGPRAARQALKG